MNRLHLGPGFVLSLRSPSVDERFATLAELAVHGANVQSGQVVAVAAFLGQEELAREVAAAAYRRGAKFVDVLYFDPYVKRARIEHADADTLDYVPDWLGARLLGLGEIGAARISFAGIVAPEALEGLDGARLGRDQLPWLKESMKIVNDRATNWSMIPCPTREWAEQVFPELDSEAALDRLWSELWHVLRLDEPDPIKAWDERVALLRASSEALNGHRFDALELTGPGTEVTIGLLPTSFWQAGDFINRNGVRHLPNLPTEEVFTAPDPLRADGHVTSTKPLVLKDGTIVRGLRVAFEGGKAVSIDADEGAEAFRTKLEVDEGATRLGELALVDRHGRVGPLGTVFYDTLLDENAASHIALGSAYAFSAGEEDRARLNESVVHVDFMIGSNELEVTGITASGERVPVLAGGDWRL
jgi:aminopeptidase